MVTCLTWKRFPHYCPLCMESTGHRRTSGLPRIQGNVMLTIHNKGSLIATHCLRPCHLIRAVNELDKKIIYSEYRYSVNLACDIKLVRAIGNQLVEFCVAIEIFGKVTSHMRTHLSRCMSHECPGWLNVLFVYTYRKTSSISRTKSLNSNVSCIILWLSSLNPLKPGVKLRMKM